MKLAKLLFGSMFMLSTLFFASCNKKDCCILGFMKFQ